MYCNLPSDTVIHIFEYINAGKYENKNMKELSLIKRCFGKFIIDGTIKKLFLTGKAKYLERYRNVHGNFQYHNIIQFLNRVCDMNRICDMNQSYEIYLCSIKDGLHIPNHSSWRVHICGQSVYQWDILKNIESLFKPNVELHLQVESVFGFDTWKYLSQIIHHFKRVRLPAFVLRDLGKLDQKLIPQNLLPYITHVIFGLKKSYNNQYIESIAQCYNLKTLTLNVFGDNDKWHIPLYDSQIMRASKLFAVMCKYKDTNKCELYLQLLKLCANNHNIRKLVIYNPIKQNLDDYGIQYLKSCVLKHIKIDCCIFDVKMIKSWRHIPTLKKLDLGIQSLTQFTLLLKQKYFSNMSHVQFSLHIGKQEKFSMSLYEKLIQIFTNNPNIVSLRLDFNNSMPESEVVCNNFKIYHNPQELCFTRE